MDLHIFADPYPDPGSQHLADPTDPDPKHWFQGYRCKSGVAIFTWRVNLKFLSLNQIFRSTGESVSVFSCDSKDGASDVQLDIAR